MNLMPNVNEIKLKNFRKTKAKALRFNRPKPKLILRIKMKLNLAMLIQTRMTDTVANVANAQVSELSEFRLEIFNFIFS